MKNDKEIVTQGDLVTVIEDFISKSSGLIISVGSQQSFTIHQKTDSKKLEIKKNDLVDVLVRKDAQGKDFVQVNFTSGKKILLTDQLIGFKPLPVLDLDVSKMPKVVTTMDLLSVFEAIEESVSTDSPDVEKANQDTEVLKKVFQSILSGGEEIGFDLSTERSWLRRLSVGVSKASA